MEPIKTPPSGPLVEMYRQELMEILTTDLHPFFRVPNTRSRWRKMRDWFYWRTVGRFKAWLHRDCGDY